MKKTILLLCSIFANFCYSQTIPVNFKGGGQTVFDGWFNINASNYSPMFYGFYPGSSMWTRAMMPNLTSSRGSTLTKIANGPNGGAYPASESLYFGGFTTVPNTLGGTLRVNGNVLTGVKTIVFQIEIGEVYGRDFHEPSGHPKLIVNGSTQIQPSYITVVNRYEDPDGQGTNPVGEPVYITTYAYQWNLNQSVFAFAIDFSAVEHCQIYEMRLDQTTIFQSQNVFEPALKLLSVGSATFNGVETSATYEFYSDPNKIINMEYSNDLSTSLWTPMGQQNTTNDGIFQVVLKKTGNHVSSWNNRMFFRIRTNQ